MVVIRCGDVSYISLGGDHSVCRKHSAVSYEYVLRVGRFSGLLLSIVVVDAWRWLKEGRLCQGRGRFGRLHYGVGSLKVGFYRILSSYEYT